VGVGSGVEGGGVGVGVSSGAGVDSGSFSSPPPQADRLATIKKHKAAAIIIEAIFLIFILNTRNSLIIEKMKRPAPSVLTAIVPQKAQKIQHNYMLLFMSEKRYNDFIAQVSYFEKTLC